MSGARPSRRSGRATSPSGPNRLQDRPTADLLILLIAGTICSSVFLYGIAVTILVFVQPEKNHGPAVALLSNSFQMLIGLLAGFIAGRTEKTTREGNGAGKDHE